MRVGIVTDSTCDLPAAALLRFGVAAIPLRVVVGDEVYRDWRDLDPVTLYGWMTDQGVVPTTRPPDVEDFVRVYRRFLSTSERIVSIHLSERLSETIDRARQAARELDAEDRIEVVDSGVATTGLAEMVLAAARRAVDGADVAEVLAEARRVRDEGVLLISPASLEWLVRGGRIDRTRGLLGGVFGLRPILTLQGGEVATEATARRGQVIDAMLDRLERRFGDAPIRVAIGFAGNDRVRIEDLKRRLEQTALTIVRGRVQLVGPAIGVQLGPGTTAICAYPDTSANPV